MTNLFRRAYISMNTLKYKIQNDESGVSAFVATLLILLVVVLMGAVFYDTISAWFKEMMAKIFGESDPNNFGTGDFK